MPTTSSSASAIVPSAAFMVNLSGKRSGLLEWPESVQMGQVFAMQHDSSA
jgi:hypothetical protein